MKLHRFLLIALSLWALLAAAALLLPRTASAPVATATTAATTSTVALPEILPPPPPRTEPPHTTVIETSTSTTKAAATTTKAPTTTHAVTEADVERLADAVLSRIITPGMTDRDKAFAIHQWTKQNVRYVGRDEKGGFFMTDRNEEVRQFIRERYAGVAKGAHPSCCGGGCGCGVLETSALLGYGKGALSDAPSASNMGLGCGNPVAIAALQAGETVLDLGSGGGSIASWREKNRLAKRGMSLAWT